MRDRSLSIKLEPDQLAYENTDQHADQHAGHRDQDPHAPFTEEIFEFHLRWEKIEAQEKSYRASNDQPNPAASVRFVPKIRIREFCDHAVHQRSCFSPSRLRSSGV